MKYDKLIRDNIPTLLKQQGKKVEYRIADDREFWLKLKEKLREEVDEFLVDENEEELADILEILDAICHYKDIKWAELKAIQTQKAKQRGNFKRQLILEEVSD